ncbi:O-antigen ligase family protein [Brevibacterium sediminis]|uniref:O-antigen ligase family protein n=1 Tax=Brevibacterium sediminis TaxID=1857024 RepID=UPI003B3AB4C3
MLNISAASLAAGGSAAPLALGIPILVFVAAVVLFTLPTASLPAIAFTVMVLVPDRLLFSSVLTLFPPEVLIMAMWSLRKVLELTRAPRGETKPKGRGPLLAALAITVTWFVIVMLVHTPGRSTVWMVGLVILVAIPTLFSDKGREAAALLKVWPWVGSAIALYSCAQAILQSNPLYDPLYRALGLPAIQHWSVFRADASLAHPLTAGMFFAMTLALCVGQWINTSRRTFAVFALINGLGVISTVSRGSYLAAGFGVAVVVVVALLAGKHFSRGRVVLIVAAFAAFAVFALQSDSFVERSNSTDGLGSASARDDMWSITEATASAYDWLGAGPGTAESASLPFNWKGLPIENSYFQLLISVGIPGLLFFGLFILAALRIGLRERNLAALGAVGALLVAIGGYAAIDGPRTALGLLAFALILVTENSNHADESADAETSEHDVTQRPRGTHRHRTL